MKNKWIITVFLTLCLMIPAMGVSAENVAISGNDQIELALSTVYLKGEDLHFSLTTKVEIPTADAKAMEKNNIRSIVNGKVTDVVSETNSEFVNEYVSNSVQRWNFTYPIGTSEIALFDRFNLVFNKAVILLHFEDGEVANYPLDMPFWLEFNSHDEQYIEGSTPVKLPFAPEKIKGAPLKTVSHLTFNVSDVSKLASAVEFDLFAWGDRMATIVTDAPISEISQSFIDGIANGVVLTEVDVDRHMAFINRVNHAFILQPAQLEKKITAISLVLDEPSFSVNYLDGKLAPQTWKAEADFGLTFEFDMTIANKMIQQ